MAVAGPINQLVILVVSGRQSSDLMKKLTKNQFYFTVVNSSGGMIQEPTLSLFIGLNDSRLPALLKLVRACCQPQKQYIPAQLNFQPGYSNLPMIEAQVGGALVYITDVEHFEQI